MISVIRRIVRWFRARRRPAPIAVYNPVELVFVTDRGEVKGYAQPARNGKACVKGVMEKSCILERLEIRILGVVMGFVDLAPILPTQAMFPGDHVYVEVGL